ncbi:MAG TPA: hypothetical protein VL117_15325 [Thermoleophilia bacterium]|nr:hypothetical protein [Thermoleophilia bacterium]
MDPIHPIIPVAPSIPTVSPAPLIGRVDRDGPHNDAGEEKRRRRRPQLQDAPDTPGASGDDDSGLHINVTA